MKSWMCLIYGGGTPLYLIAAENEEKAWSLIKNELRKTEGYRVMSYDLKRWSGGLVEFPYFTAPEETIIDIHETYADRGTVRKGTYEGL